MAIVEVHVLGHEELVAKYRRLSGVIAQVLVHTMQTEMTRLADYVRASKLSGDPLHRRTGALSRAVTGSAETTGAVIVGHVGTKGIPYAYVHEMGGTFQIREHTRRTGFGAEGERVRLLTKTGKVRAAVKSKTTGIVKAHTATYPQRAFLRPSLQEHKAVITEALRASIMDVMHAA